MAKWQVRITDEASNVFASKALTTDDKIVIQKWAELVRDHGPEAITERPGMWADHPLYGEWRGHRASSFSNSGRIIYKVEERVVTVSVVCITTDHDYRRKK
jgi:mRNA-degrading endonuclease YafQ of YafQ-DinJ toxin-antitoxin module